MQALKALPAADLPNMAVDRQAMPRKSVLALAWHSANAYTLSFATTANSAAAGIQTREVRVSITGGKARKTCATAIGHWPLTIGGNGSRANQACRDAPEST